MFKKIMLVSIVMTAVAALTGCASIVNGTNQSVSVNTGNVGGATCSLQNDKGRWFVSNTPGSVVVNRSFKDLQIDCQKPGYKDGYKDVASHTKAMAFGNLVFGGVVGAGVDVADGAAYDYPTEVYVPMRKAYA